MTRPPYEEVDHTADWALRIRGRDMSELCLVAASAMMAACGARPETGPTAERQLELRAEDREGLLVVWLEEILFSIETRRRVPIRIEVSVTPQLNLVAQWTDAPLGGVEKPIKAVTYNDLTVLETKGGLEATVVFDV